MGEQDKREKGKVTLGPFERHMKATILEGS